MNLNSFAYALPQEIQNSLDSEIAKWHAENRIERIWQKDASVWTNDDEAKWLGWLNIIDEELADLEKYRELQADINAAGFTDILLLGMGGSSLCPEVLAMTFGKRNFHILDSTVPAQIKSVEHKINLEKTLFIVASKSGSTLEPNCFKQYFFELVAEKVGRENAGKQFIAITDPGSKMEHVAREDHFRQIFFGKPEVGGRFSALSAFGMTAAAVMGIDVEQFLQNAKEMATSARETDVQANSAALLGLILGVCHGLGRDKLTIFASPEIYDLGAWLEQLIAESTGKNGVAIIPVDREPLQKANEYSTDRVFAVLGVRGHDPLDALYDDIAAAGHPAVKIELNSINNLGQEFFRWEFATAVAGSVMKINPFNQPDVESAKIEARKITDEYEQNGSLPAEEPFFETDKIKFFAGSDYAARLRQAASGLTAESIVKAHINQIATGDYFAVLAYAEMNIDNERVFQAVREKVLARCKVATCLGFGPRFLHSTGQAYKGGANNGVFLQITSDDDIDLDVPGQKYTFGVVKAAQSRGDFQVLVDRNRRALRIHICKDVVGGLERLAELI